MLIDKDQLLSEVEAGYVSQRRHPSLPLYIYNYTPEAVYSNRWNDITRMCRGLILDEDFNIVARPFSKFFNLNTELEPSTCVDYLPKGTTPVVTEKMDGSLGILWRWNGHEGIATRGSFTSEQAIWATNFWKNLHFCRWHFEFPGDCTPCFEIIYPENRIVVDYHGESKLTLLGVVRNSDGSEYSQEELKNTFYPDIVPAYEGKSLSDCISESEMDIPLNAEGYVLRYDHLLGKPPLRIKIKFSDYLRLHKVMFSLSNRVIWDVCAKGTDLNFLYGALPEDAMLWARDMFNDYQMRFVDMLTEALKVFKDMPAGSRKDKAIYFQQWPEIQSICFALLDNKDANGVVWKKLEPKKAEFFRRIPLNEL